MSDERPEGVPVAVREVSLRIVGHLVDRRQLAVERRVAHPGIRERVVRAEREILRHPFGEPKRRIDLGERLQSGTRLSMSEDVVLKGVHHLVR